MCAGFIDFLNLHPPKIPSDFSVLIIKAFVSHVADPSGHFSWQKEPQS